MKQITITLDDVSTLPEQLRLQVQNLAPLLQREGTWEAARHLLEVAHVAQQIEDLVSRTYVVGYHGTKELKPGTIKSRGLRPVDPATHVREFHAYLRTDAPEMLPRFESAHAAWLEDTLQMPLRKDMLHFFLSRADITSDVWRFFTFYGGEMVHWPFDDRTPSPELTFLERLGTPAIVKFRIPASEVNAVTPLSQLLISSFASTLVPNFDSASAAATSAAHVLPEDIIDVSAPPAGVAHSLNEPASWRYLDIV